MPKYESDFHTTDRAPLPWKARDTELLDANGAMIATFEVRHTTKGLLAGAYKNCQWAADAANHYEHDGLLAMQERVAMWADKQFPNRTTADVLLKLYEELGEYARNPKAELEFADVMVLLLDAAHMNDINIAKAVDEKMTINEERKWQVDPNTRIMRHVP
jgi:NTP pyrophosphatase (non-canonical NTP hydrolase)